MTDMIFHFDKEWFHLKTLSSMLIELAAAMLWRPQYHGCQVCLVILLNRLISFCSISCKTIGKNLVLSFLTLNLSSEC